MSIQLPESVRRLVAWAHDKKAFDVVVLDLRESNAFTDYFVICSARSTRQVRAIVDEITTHLRASHARPSHVEGYDRAEWVLIDCFEVVIHIFTHDTRRFYDLERLWGAARRIACEPPHPSEALPRLDAEP